MHGSLCVQEHTMNSLVSLLTRSTKQVTPAGGERDEYMGWFTSNRSVTYT